MNDSVDQLNDFFRLPISEEVGSKICLYLERNIVDLWPNWHALGFIHCLLATASSGATLRLHLWSSDFSHPCEQSAKIHDHRFDVNSRVLAGAVENTTYEFRSSLQGDMRTCRVTYGGEESWITESDDFGFLRPVSTAIIGAPESYVVQKFDLHETRLISPRALTLVRTSPADDYNPRIVIARNDLLQLKRSRLLVDKSFWIEAVRDILLA